MPWLTAKDVTTDPVLGEVSRAVAAYKWMLVETNHAGLRHRIACWFRHPEALGREGKLIAAKQNAQKVINRSPEHRAVFESLVSAQPESVQREDNLLSLLNMSIKS